jgi:hypothetical protein
MNMFYRKEYRSWNFGLGIANIFDTSSKYVEPFRGKMAPIPGLGRRLMVNIGIRL